MLNPQIIVALELVKENDLFKIIDQLDPRQCRLKVGKALFTQYGPALIQQLQSRGFEIFLDLKFHDIPHTVAQAVIAAADCGVWMLTLHAGGGEAMLRAAVAALQGRERAPLLIAVTVLTSLQDSDLRPLGMVGTVSQQVDRLANLAQQSGMSGVVCSAQEAKQLKARLGDRFILVTPGIRPHNVAAQDQRRLMTPAQAVANGADYLVIGRPITQAFDPAAALQQIQHSIEPVPSLSASS
ncbi:MAG: orotidine-5'-phosphate decarboxylase [Candidatus Symbiodolus clandestinus]